MIKAVVFDCFGVLLADVLRTRINEVELTDKETAQHMRDVLTQLDYRMITEQEMAEQLGPLMGVAPGDVHKLLVDGEVKNQSLWEYIQTLKGTYKLAVLSNVRGRYWLDDRLGKDDLDALFDVVVASGDVGFVKPHPEIYELVVRELGVEPDEAVMIDDIEGHCDGARRVGMQAIHFTSTQQCVADLKKLFDEQG